MNAELCVHLEQAVAGVGVGQAVEARAVVGAREAEDVAVAVVADAALVVLAAART